MKLPSRQRAENCNHYTYIMFIQEMEGCDTEEDIDVDGISTDSDETQLNNESLNLPVETHVSPLENCT